MSATVYDLLEWKPVDLADRARAAATAADTTMDARRILSDGAESLADSWRGLAGDAAHTAVTSEMGKARDVLVVIDRLDEAIANAASSLEGPLAMLRRAVAEAQTDGLLVADNGSVRMFKPKATFSGLRPASQENLDYHGGRIAEAMTAMADADTAGAHAIRAVVEDLTAHATPAAPIGPTTAALAQKALTDGLVTPEDITLALDVFTGSGITPEVIQSLRDGGGALPLPAGALDTLESFYRDAGATGLQSMFTQLAASSDPRAQELSRTFGDGLLILSNEQAVSSDGTYGGYDRLPGSVRLWLENPTSAPPFDQWTESLSEVERERIGDASALAEAHLQAFPPVGTPAGDPGLEEFWSMVAAGDAPAGTELSTTLLTTVAGMSETINLRPELHEGSEGFGQSMLDIASRNHEAIASVMLGDSDGGGSSDATAAAVLEPLFLRDWPDGGTALGQNFDWMSDIMAQHPSGPEFDRAALTSAELARFVSDGDRWHVLMGSDGQPGLSTTNPSLVQHMAHGLRDAIPFMAQTAPGDDLPPAWSGDNAIDEPRVFNHARRTLSLLVTEPGAHSEVVEATRGHLLDAYHSGDDYGAGRISALLYGAEHQSMAIAAHSDEALAREAYAERERRYDSLAGMSHEVLARHPASGMAVAATRPFLKDMFLGPEPVAASSFAIDAVPDRSDEQVRALRHLALQESLSAVPPTAVELDGYETAIGPEGIRPIPEGTGDPQLWSQQIDRLVESRGLRAPVAHAEGWFNDFNEGYREVLPSASDAVAKDLHEGGK